jgi:uncharacterized RDD family membrane protein YckC/ribosomal protein S27E
MPNALTIKPNELTSECSELLEFRCHRCWNSNVAASSASGSAFECRYCGQALTVPEATPERIARAKALVQEQPTITTREPGPQLDVPLTDRDIVRLASEELRVPLNQQNFTDHPSASLWARFFAQMVDGFLFFGAVLAAFVLMTVLFGKDLDKAQLLSARNLVPLIVLASLPLILSIVQWVLISNDGQTIGKKLLMIRIVTTRGTLPGFVQGVILRNWLRTVLGACIPFFGLLDPAFALLESRRSLHDLISGTRVVQVL